MEERYSLGRQTFSRLIDEELIYVDKTAQIHSLIDKKHGIAYFLSRPRRFGKSLLLSTFKSIFEGKQELFKGLYIYDKIEWQSHPIIHISMTEMNYKRMGLEKSLWLMMQSIATEHDILLEKESFDSPLKQLVLSLHQKYEKQVVILVDEYDKPITDGLENNDSTIAIQNRDVMKEFYSGLKDIDSFIRFLFITGISKFAKVSIFSELNHLKDITLDRRYTTICGYTEAEIKHYFPQGLAKLAEINNLSDEACWAKIKDWYNGFSWDGKNFVYNPFSTLNVLDSSTFSNYWFASGTPTFLVKLLNEEFTYYFANIQISTNDYDLFDLTKLKPISVLLQTGYLTIKEKIEDDILVLDFPNKEVRESFNEMLLGDYLDHTYGEMGVSIFHIRNAFKANDINKVMTIIETLFASVPNELFDKRDSKGNIKAVGENFYHAIIYLIFNTLGVKMQAEVSVMHGKIDAVVQTTEHIYLFEFKKDQSPKIAIEQMRTNHYADTYTLANKPIYLIGVSFSMEKRGIDAWDKEII